jgi:hypothetical protein
MCNTDELLQIYHVSAQPNKELARLTYKNRATIVNVNDPRIDVLSFRL